MTQKRKYCLILDLIDDPELIKEYEAWHRNVWPEVQMSILESGITDMEIFRSGNRLVMHVEVTKSFSFEQKSLMDSANPVVIKWEMLMSKYQQPLPWAKEGVKWVKMDQIYSLRG